LAQYNHVCGFLSGNYSTLVISQGEITMSTQELDNQDTLILERFEYKFDGQLAEYGNEEYSVEPPTKAYCDPDNIVAVLHESVEKLGPLAISGLDSDIESSKEITVGSKTKGYTDLLELNSTEDTTTHMAIEYVNMVCELFEVDQDTFIEHTSMREPQDDWPVLYDDPQTNLVAVISPYIPE